MQWMKNAVFISENTDPKYIGRNAIIGHILQTYSTTGHKYFAHMANIVSVDASDTEPALKYQAGTRCVVLAADEENKYESIVFIDTNDDGHIKTIIRSTDGRYHFKLDEKPKYESPLRDVKIPDTVFEPILMRARFHGIIGDDVKDSDVTEYISEYKGV